MKQLIDYLSSETRIENTVLLEKDIILHSLLCELLKNEFFRVNFVFKGGTCLTKCYLGYYRFSEDLDFTWKNQKHFSGKSQKDIRRILSKKIAEVITTLKSISEKLQLDFEPDKANKKYIELGGSNKFSTFKLWYASETLGTEQFVKIQINFLEKFFYPFSNRTARSIIEGINRKEFAFLFPEQAHMLTLRPNIYCYDIKEILLEKFRAILTRRTVKARDFIDIFAIEKHENITHATLRREIIAKTKFMLRYNKYLQNLKNFKLETFIFGEEEKLLLRPLDKDFAEFLHELYGFITSLTEELSGKNQKASRS
jgi:predicted nucleotidyltransferase component of viral defense system